MGGEVDEILWNVFQLILSQIVFHVDCKAVQ